MLRIIQSLLIVAFFAAMMTLLFRDHVIPSLTRSPGVEVDRRILTDSWANQDDWMEIRLGGMVLGAMRTVAEQEDDESYTVYGHLELRGGFVRGRLISSARLNPRLEVESARMAAHLPTGGGELATGEDLAGPELPEGAIELLALLRGQRMNVRISRGDAVNFLSESLPRPVTVADSINPILRGEMLSEGVVYSTDLYDPFFGGGAGQAQLEWVNTAKRIGDDGEEEEVREVELRVAGSKTTLFVDQNGNIIRREIPLMTGAGVGAGADAVPRLVLLHRQPQQMQEEYPGLLFLPEHPPISPGEVTGTNRGEVFRGLSLFSLVGDNLTGRLLPGQDN